MSSCLLEVEGVSWLIGWTMSNPSLSFSVGLARLERCTWTLGCHNSIIRGTVSFFSSLSLKTTARFFPPDFAISCFWAEHKWLVIIQKLYIWWVLWELLSPLWEIKSSDSSACCMRKSAPTALRWKASSGFSRLFLSASFRVGIVWRDGRGCAALKRH